MAEINIQRKRTPLWPWLVGLIFLALLIWLVVDGMTRNEKRMDGNNKKGTDTGKLWEAAFGNREENSKNTPAKIKGYLKFIESGNKSHLMSNSSYSGEALKRLAEALAGIARDKNINKEKVLNQYKRLKEYADDIIGSSSDPGRETFSVNIKKAIVTATDMITIIQEEKFTDKSIDIRAIQDVAISIDINVSVRNQKQKIDRFLRLSGAAIDIMANPYHDSINTRENKISVD